MTTGNDLWESLGELTGEEAGHVLARLFALFEEEQQRRPDDPAAPLFFRNLATAIDQTCECNLNRR